MQLPEIDVISPSQNCGEIGCAVVGPDSVENAEVKHVEVDNGIFTSGVSDELTLVDVNPHITAPVIGSGPAQAIAPTDQSPYGSSTSTEAPVTTRLNLFFPLTPKTTTPPGDEAAIEAKPFISRLRLVVDDFFPEQELRAKTAMRKTSDFINSFHGDS